ncbi:hypothetical protein [Haloplanus aerogenes]|uniref:DOD-type homing endonuclease domain-containing protein n=1 Tax=Haloplanus aerogenes TaxID=660522 RepID=A0A3M0CFH6_9EURY|nr:hypothetical protein [Haloplanus aerogenes]AZH24802.1 hypothetical protein DU502_05170 [Haloplanus aerogenes]RMB08344.1 hypothetical protein ATH50_3559 [Haloplanus aerogenes]
MVSQYVSEQALAETYDPETGWETVQQYREAKRLADNQPTIARAEIARQVGRPPSAVRGWLAEGKIPRVVKGLNTARDRGWIGIEETAERFRALNQLVAWIFSGGGLRSDAFVPVFSVDDQLTLATIHQLLREVNVSYRIREQDDPDRHLEIIPKDGASILGRVLTILGAPKGVKARKDQLTLPSYLTDTDNAHRRDFLRIYVLNRGRELANQETAGVHLYGLNSPSYCQELKELIEAATSGTATVSSQNRIWISSESVHDLAGEKPLRSGLATNAVFGSLTPPTERAVASTYRQEKTPGGYQYWQLFNEVRESDASRAELSARTGLRESTIRSWKRGSSPYVHNGLETTQTHGWLTPPAESDIALGLTSLLGWLIAQGSLRDTYYPTFGLQSPDQEPHFSRIAAEVGVSYSVVHRESASRRTEIRPTEDGAVLGRVLYALGAPRGTKAEQGCLLPVYLHHHASHARRFVRSWCLHHAHSDGQRTINIPPRFGHQFPKALETLLVARLSWDVDWKNERKLVVQPSEEWDGSIWDLS